MWQMSDLRVGSSLTESNQSGGEVPPDSAARQLLVSGPPAAPKFGEHRNR